MEENLKKRFQDRIIGCLVGGAVGDALGYPIEFWEYSQVKNTYGEDGITSYVMPHEVAEISDDTQMTLYTACGLLNGYSDGLTMKCPVEMSQKYIRKAYEEWYHLQTIVNPQVENPSCFISNLKAMQAWRAPGMTCMSALRDEKTGSLVWHINDSKGCGGIMRVAPIALFNDLEATVKDRVYLGAEVAALTHGHSLGFIPTAMMVYLLSEIVYPTHNCSSLSEIIRYVLEEIKMIYGKKYARKKYLLALVQHAVDLATSNSTVSDVETITILGEGKVAEETIAIAIYCCLKYPDDFKKAIIASVNHGGDSDSTGSVAGNILGAWLGYDAIPNNFKKCLEEVDTIKDIGSRLYNSGSSNSLM